MAHRNQGAKSPKTREYTNTVGAMRLLNGVWIARSGTEDKYYEATFLWKPSRKEALAALECAKELHADA